MYLTPHTASAMAMFGFVYLWYLMAVLLLEIWLDYRRDIVAMAQTTRGPLGLLYRLLTLGSNDVSAEALQDRRPGELRRDARRHPLGLPAARVRRVHLRLGEGEPVVVDAAHADRVPVLGHRLRHRRRDAALHGDHAPARARGRHAVRRHDRPLPLLRLHHRLLAGDARPHPPDLRGGRVLPHPRLHGEDAAVPVAHHRADRHRHPGAARAARADAARRA